MNTLAGTALGDYGHDVFKRDHFTCVYCGFDGRNFDNWLQLSVDHVRPRSAAGEDTLENTVTACKFCNSATSRMKFSPDAGKDEILELKRGRVAERREVLDKWGVEGVARTFLDRPLLPVI